MRLPASSASGCSAGGAAQALSAWALMPQAGASDDECDPEVTPCGSENDHPYKVNGGILYTSSSVALSKTYGIVSAEVTVSKGLQLVIPQDDSFHPCNLICGQKMQ